MENKLRRYFDDMVVYKDLKASNFFNSLSLPAFLRDFVIKMFADESGNFNVDEIKEFVFQYMPRKEDWNRIKNDILVDYKTVTFLSKVSIEIDINSRNVHFAIPEFGLTYKDTIIEDFVWEKVKIQFIGKNSNPTGVWGKVTIGAKDVQKTKTKISLLGFESFCPFEINLEYYKDVRKYFSIDEWIDIILGAIDYNANGYDNEIQKMAMLKRLLPFVEKRLNIIELAPKGTGKSYLFGRVSKYGWLVTGGTLSRAKMFYDLSSQREGLVVGHDYVALDEVQTIRFTDVDEMRGALKGYLESGEFTVGKNKTIADSGVILLGNIPEESMDEKKNMFDNLPYIFKESALIDRFHGYIKGWEIPRMNDGLKVSSWALNSEYFCSILHLLRDDISYRTLVDKIVIYKDKADTRDVEAVKRMATAFLKLLFPHVQSSADISKSDFEKYCLMPAIDMRRIIKHQLGILDVEFRHKPLPNFYINQELVYA